SLHHYITTSLHHAITTSLEAVPLESAIERAAAQAERLRRLADVAVEPRHRLLDQEALDVFQAHFLDPRRGVLVQPQPQIARTDGRGLRHQHAAFDGVIELADVAGPGMIEQRLERLRLEAGDVLAVALRMLLEEVHRERGNVLAAFTQRRQRNLDR